MLVDTTATNAKPTYTKQRTPFKRNALSFCKTRFGHTVYEKSVIRYLIITYRQKGKTGAKSFRFFARRFPD